MAGVPSPFPLIVHGKEGSGCPHEVRWVQDTALATLRQIERGNDWTQQLAREFKLAARYVRDDNQQHATSEDSWVERGPDLYGAVVAGLASVRRRRAGGLRKNVILWTLPVRSKDSTVKAAGYFVALTGEQCRDAAGRRR